MNPMQLGVLAVLVLGGLSQLVAHMAFATTPGARRLVAVADVAYGVMVVSGGLYLIRG